MNQFRWMLELPNRYRRKRLCGSVQTVYQDERLKQWHWRIQWHDGETSWGMASSSNRAKMACDQYFNGD